MNGDINKFSVEATLEKDIARLSEEVKNVQNRPEFQTAPAREVIKESMKIFAGNASSSGQQQRVATGAPTNDDDDPLLPGYMKTETAETKLQVEHLLDLSLRGGFSQAFDEAKKHGGFMVDALHDALVDKVLPELEQRGLIK